MPPLLPYFLALVSGVLASFPGSKEFLFPFFLPISAIAVGFWAFFKTGRITIWRFIVFLSLLSWGILHPFLEETIRPKNHILKILQEKKRSIVTGTISKYPIKHEDKIQFTLNLETIQYEEPPLSTSGVAQITLYNTDLAVRLGDRLKVSKIRLKVPRNFKNPGRLDYKLYLRSKGIDVIGGISKSKNIEKLNFEEPNVFAQAFISLKEKLHHLLDKYLTKVPASIIKAMILGEKQFLEDKLKQAYITSGLAHLLAVSGLHIGFIAGATYFLFYPLCFKLLVRFLPLSARSGLAKKITAILTLIPVGLYMGLVGAKVSAIRAGLMVIFVLISFLINRKQNLFNALLLAAFIILLINPYSVLTPGFQLSFMAVFTILFYIQIVYPLNGDSIDWMGDIPWYKRLPFIRRDSRFRNHWTIELISSTTMVSLPAVLGVLPISIFFFNQISFLGIFLNILFIPLASFLIPFAFLSCFLSFFWEPLASVFMPLVNLLTQIFIHIPQEAQKISFSSTYVSTPPEFWPILYYIVLFGFPLWILRQQEIKKSQPPEQWSNRSNTFLQNKLTLISKSKQSSIGIFNRKFFESIGFIFCISGVFIWLCWPRFPNFHTNELDLCLLDVGQGESIFIETPDHKVILLDGGGYYKNSLDVGKVVLAPFLWNRGISKIDYFGATHSDNDHIAGLESLINYFPIKKYLTRFHQHEDPRLKNLKATLKTKGTQIVSLEPNAILSVGEVKIKLLHPSKHFIEKYPSIERISNQHSWIVLVQFKDVRFLLSGDITSKEESYLINQQINLKAQILKAPHHGSKFSSSQAFLDAVNPKDVLISSGLNNPFHHPHPEIIERYKESNINVWRTDQQGALCVNTNGHNHRIFAHSNL